MNSEVKIELEGLKKGMYVSRLDRPWIETSFLLEGLIISEYDEIESLKKLCKYVYVDTARGDSPHPDFRITDEVDNSDRHKANLAGDKTGDSASPAGSHTKDEQSKKKFTEGAEKSRQGHQIKKDSDSSETGEDDESGVERTESGPEPVNRRDPDRVDEDKKNQELSRFEDNPNLSTYNGYIENISSRRKRVYKDKSTFSVELKTASVVHEKIGNDYQQIMSDLRNGRNLDLDIVAEGITDMTNSIIRNPSAMTWVAHIKRIDEYSYCRALGTSVWCATFGRHLGLEKPAIETLSLGGLLLDIGKSVLPVEILQLSRELTPMEHTVMQKHVQFAKTIITEANWSDVKQSTYNDILNMVAEHHERADASGYPDALSNKQISFFGRMVGIVDSFDAMTSKRPYMHVDPMSASNAVNELYGLRDSKFQAELVEQFIQTVGVYPTGSLVELNTGEVGVVVAINSLRRLRPTLMLILDENKKSLETLREVELDKLSGDVVVSHGLAAGAFGINLAELFL